MAEKRMLSIIIPVHNAEEYLTECVESVLSNAYQNFEKLKELSARYVMWRGLGTTCAKIYRMEVLNGVAFPSGLARMEDVVFALYAFRNASKLVFCREGSGKYRYRLHVGSACNSYDPDFAQKVDYIMEELHEFVKTDGQPELYAASIDETRIYLFHEWLLLSVVIDSESTLSQKLKKIKGYLAQLCRSLYGQQQFTEKKWIMFNNLCT